MLGEAAPVAIVQCHGNPFALAKRCGDGLGEAAAILVAGRDPIDDHQNVLARSHARFGTIVIQTQQLTIYLRTDEPGGPKLCGDLNIRAVRRRRQRE